MKSVTVFLVACVPVAFAASGMQGMIQPARPLDAPAVGIEREIDCAMRNLTYSYAKDRLPSRGNLRDVWDALELSSLCQMPEPADDTATSRAKTASDASTASISEAKARGAAMYFVDGTHGNDGSVNCTEAAPCKSIGRAVGVSRAAAVGSSSSFRAIIVHGGEYFLENTIELGPDDSRLTIAAAPGERVVVSGGRPVKGLQWSPVQQGMGAQLTGINAVFDEIYANGTIESSGIVYGGQTGTAADCASVCEGNSTCTSYTWHDQSQGAFANKCYFRTDGQWLAQQQSGHVSGQRFNVYKASIDLGGSTPRQLWRAEPPSSPTSSSSVPAGSTSTLAEQGRRLQHARYPSGNPETNGLWTVPGTGYVAAAKGWLPPVKVPAATEVTLATPQLNGTHFPQYGIGVGGAGRFFDPPRSRWALAHPSGGGGSTYEITTGMVWDDATWTDKKWSGSDASDAWLHTYHCGHWGGWIFSVGNVDESTGTI